MRRGVVIAGVLACCAAFSLPAAAASAPLGPLQTDNAGRCDFLDPSLCLYPWPNDYFTRADDSTPTGKRLHVNYLSTPANRFGVHIDMAAQNNADGFSPGNLIVTKVPGLESQAAFDRSGIVPITDMARYADKNQPVVVIDTRTLKRQPVWAEVDANPANAKDVTLVIRPSRNFTEGHRYIVALRNLKDADGNVLQPREEFRAYRDAIATDNPAIEARRKHFEEDFATLKAARIERDDLYLSWDFTVASETSLAGRALAIRNDAFAKLGDHDLADRKVEGRSPAFVENPNIPDALPDALAPLPIPDLPLPVSIDKLDGYREYKPCSAGDPKKCETGESDTTARRIIGSIPVPCYLTTPLCLPSGGFNYGRDGLPHQLPLNTAIANVICTVPRSAVTGPSPEPPRVSLYGHGLLGSADEVMAGNVQAMGNEHNIVFCATDWAGMSTLDVPNVLLLLQDLSNFNSLADRSQQGFVNFMELGRWLIHPDGASKVAGFPKLQTKRLFYDGNSQGAILGGALAALSPDFDRAVLGVAGMNYSTLLRRSVDFDQYAKGDIEGLHLPIGLYQSYPNELERPLILSIMQLLWDRGEADGYAQHMTDSPLPGTPPHNILLHTAVGDHQVANVSADTEARTIGACANPNEFDPGRSFDKKPLWDVPLFGDPRCKGSGIVYWDSGPLTADGKRGTPVAPPVDLPPRKGNDPHSLPRSTKAARSQKSAFLQENGTIPDVCGGKACHSDPK